MRLLKEIIRKENINFSGKQIYREAVRAIIIKDKKLLMIYSNKQGDYKFPGGGVDSGETYEEALIREVKEECGAKLLTINMEFGKVLEYDIPGEEDFDVFKMFSFYYLCEVDNVFEEQSLEQYEYDLGFEPVWIDIDTSITTNKQLINTSKAPYWTRRETYILELLKEQFDT